MSQGRFSTLMWRAVLVLLLLGIGAGMFFWLSQTGTFAIEEIEVEGNRVTGTGEIMEKAGPLLKGHSLFRLSFAEAESAVADLPYVESAELERDFPKTVRIRIREYDPVACLLAAENRAFLLASDGQILVALEQPDAAYPVITTREPCGEAVGAVPACPDVITAVQFLENVPVNFNQEFAEVTVAGGEISARTRANVLVRFGSLEDYGLKFEVLRQLIARSAADGVSLVVDVSVPDRPITRQE